MAMGPLVALLLQLAPSPSTPVDVHPIRHQAAADADASTSARPAPNKPPPWVFRVHAGIGYINDSQQARALRQDGYSYRYRPEVTLDLSTPVADRVYVGGWGGWAGYSWQGRFESTYLDHDGPRLTQHVISWGAQAWLVPCQSPRLAIGPRVGLAHWRLDLSADARWHTNPAIGGEVSIEFSERNAPDRPLHAGLSLSASWAPGMTRGLYDMSTDVGSITLSFFGGFGG